MLRNLSVLFSLIFVLSACGREALVLREESLGDFALSANMPLSFLLLSTAFEDYEFKHSAAEQDGSDYLYYEAFYADDSVFWLESLDEDATLLDALHITDPRISDQYGAHLGLPFSELQVLRPSLKLKTDEHFHTFAYVPGSHIAYELLGEFEGPDKQDFGPADVTQWQVIDLRWGSK